ncbi:MAG: RdgB/HAM1 family non-canonical purine NTP pyrophosphatase [Spirochaetaceae bacterium]|jgi:XTP/dITP diphosphohydrolase|nr:RdgB/HAM1 family non-canonical purine NTP pyrophosphatase [Spirochaetaceae bacterium]
MFYKNEFNKLWFASSNEHKYGELAAILNEAAPEIELKLPKDAKICFDAEENGADFAQNALIKARALNKIVHEPVIADDSGLCVDALGGAPGIFSARYGMQNGKKLDSTERNALLLAQIGDNLPRSARFVCAMVLLFNKEKFILVQETLEGEIVYEPKGGGGFGYDPLLLIPELGRTVAELNAVEKNRLSHRAKAARRLFS